MKLTGSKYKQNSYKEDRRRKTEVEVINLQLEAWRRLMYIDDPVVDQHKEQDNKETINAVNLYGYIF